MRHVPNRCLCGRAVGKYTEAPSAHRKEVLVLAHTRDLRLWASCLLTGPIAGESYLTLAHPDLNPWCEPPGAGGLQENVVKGNRRLCCVLIVEEMALQYATRAPGCGRATGIENDAASIVISDEEFGIVVSGSGHPPQPTRRHVEPNALESFAILFGSRTQVENDVAIWLSEAQRVQHDLVHESEGLVDTDRHQQPTRAAGRKRRSAGVR
eukprot:6083798-Prymnesium_polylepis.3